MAAVIKKTENRVVDELLVTVTYVGETNVLVNDDEIRAYINRGASKYPEVKLKGLTLDIDGDEVGIHYLTDPVPFQRIRRITGYLVGTMDRWNDAKTAEEADRVKHKVDVA